MQHGLLALAIALIAAIVAALFAPAYVDWNEWRATFERQASELAGAPVQIRGPIEAAILPVPEFILRDVRIGDPEKSTGIQAGEVKGTLSLGALLRGAFEAEEFVLVRPAIRIAVEEGGRIVLPDGGTKAPDELAISRFSVDGGSLTIEDLANRSLTFIDGISASGEMRSRSGPLRLEANMRMDKRRWNLRASTGVFGADGARTRLILERPDDGVSLDADGLLAFTGGLPRFNGKINLAHAKGAGLPWKISANANANGDLVTFESFDLSAGGGETPLELAGNLQFVPRRGGHIEGALTAKRLDLDRALGVKAGEGLAAALAPLRDTIMRAGELPLKGRISFSSDLVIANGAQVRDLRGEIGLGDGFIGVENVEAKLPGRSTVSAKSSGANKGYFLGEFVLEAEDPATLARWALGPEKAVFFDQGGPLRLAGKSDWSAGKISIENLDFTYGDANLTGNFSVTQKDGAQPLLSAAFVASDVDLDLLAPFGEAFWSNSKDSDVSLQFQGQSLRLFQKEIEFIYASIKRQADGLVVDRITLTNFDGLSLKAKGKILNSDPSSRLEFGLEVVKPEGFLAVAEHFGGPDFSSVARHALKSGLPISFAGTAGMQSVGKHFVAAGTGKLADLPMNATIRLDEKNNLTQAKLALEARDSGKLISLFGISPGLPAPGDGKFEIEILASKAGAFPLQASLSVPGADVSASGDIILKDNRIEPRLELKLDASDLRLVLAAASRANDVVATKGSAKLNRSGEALSFDNLLLDVGKTRVSGQISLANIEKPSLAGKLALDRLELTDLLALTAGSSGNAKSFWPSSKLSAAPFAGASGAVDMEVAALGLTGAQIATAAKFKVKLGNEIEIGDFTADFAGGKLVGEGKIARGEALSFDGRASLNGFDVARVLVPGTWKANARGKGNLTLALSGSGATPAALAAKFSGQGTLSLENLEIDALDPLAIATVISAAEKHLPKDEGHLISGVNSMLARAPLKLAKLEAPLIVANGSLRTGKAIAKTGDVEVTAEASFDLAKLLADGAVEMETAGTTAARPGVTVRWRGPIGSPERLLDVSALSTAINLRAMERETKRLERRDRTELPPSRPQ